MALFVHLTAKKNFRSILRSGIRMEGGGGVFCLPILPSYAISHQWLRELRRGGQRTFVAVSGWRYAPEQHGRRPCACPACLSVGAFKAADIRTRFGGDPPPTKPELMAQLAAATDSDEICSVLWSLGSRSRTTSTNGATGLVRVVAPSMCAATMAR